MSAIDYINSREFEQLEIKATHLSRLICASEERASLMEAQREAYLGWKHKWGVRFADADMRGMTFDDLEKERELCEKLREELDVLEDELDEAREAAQREQDENDWAEDNRRIAAGVA